MNKVLCERFFSVLADRNRIAIISELLTGDKTVTEIYTALGMEQSLASHHLKSLKDSGFVTYRNVGKARIYSANRETIQPVMDIMQRHAAKFCRVACSCHMEGWVMTPQMETEMGNEGDIILEKLGVLQKKVATIGRKESRETVKKIMDFFNREMETHFRFEEVSIFPAVERKNAEDRDLIKSLVLEHKMLREKIREFESLIDRSESEQVQESRLEQIVKELASMFSSHIQKEENILLPHAKKALGEKEMRRIEAMHGH